MIDRDFSGKRVLGINSLGRIGKLTLWHHIHRKHFGGIVVNQGREIGCDLDAVAQTIENDSTYGKMHTFLWGIASKPRIKIVDRAAGKLMIDEIPVVILREHRNPIDIPWRDYGVKIVVDCTGQFLDPTLTSEEGKGSLRGHFKGGAKVVIASSAFKVKNKALSIPEDAVTLIYGVNHHAFEVSKHCLISAASCTTTALAHMLHPLLENERTNRILTASMSTIHAATNSQPVLDNVPQAGDKDLRKSRSVLDNIILTSTNAAKALSTVIPEINDIGFMADSVRIPMKTESLIILNITFQMGLDAKGKLHTLTRTDLNDIYRQAEREQEPGMLVYSDAQNVSRDVSGINASVVIEGEFNHTRTAFLEVDVGQLTSGSVQSGKKTLSVPVVHAKIFGWYDNEYGSYTNRVGDLAAYLANVVV
jgi:glyceraldehyde 3-phosphate dehydrogenase